jgi:1-acyl-sn-glycerol-3-phosphate acyltransferase
VSKVRKHQQARGWALLTAVAILKPAIIGLLKREWIDGDKIPATGGCVVVLNHVSHLDPIAAAHIIYDYGRAPRYLAKSGLFRTFFVGTILRGAKQIPVERMSADAVGAFDAAVAAVRAGEVVVVYPEGTITRDPDGWPMRGKTGAARIALETQAPVVPIAQWGVQDLLPAYSAKLRPFPRKKVRVKVGDPVDLSDVYDVELGPEVIKEATDRIMAAITALVEELRGEKAPATRFDPRAAGVKEIGNPTKDDA